MVSEAATFGNWMLVYKCVPILRFFIPDRRSNLFYSLSLTLFLSASLPGSHSFSSLAFYLYYFLLLCHLSLPLSFRFPLSGFSNPLLHLLPTTLPASLCPSSFLSASLSLPPTILHTHVRKQNEGYRSILFFHNSSNITPFLWHLWIS